MAPDNDVDPTAQRRRPYGRSGSPPAHRGRGKAVMVEPSTLESQGRLVAVLRY